MNGKLRCLRAVIVGALSVSIAGALSGCGQVAVFGHTLGEPGSTAPPGAQATQAAASPTAEQPAEFFQKVRTVSVVFMAETATKVAENPKLDPDALLAEIKDELKSRNALDDADPQTTAVAEIAIDEYTLSPVSNAILFGQIVSIGRLSGTLRVRDAQGNELSKRRVEAKSQVSVAAKGETKNPLEFLYSQFAVQTGNTLTGKIIKPVESDNWRPR